MSLIEIIQLAIGFIALAIQVWATFLAKSLRPPATPSALWKILIWLNVFVLARRVLSVAEIAWNWHTAVYHSFTVLTGIGVSVCMLLTVITIRRQLAASAETQRKTEERLKSEQLQGRELAQATVSLAKNAEDKRVRVEDSDAYKLALTFLERQRKDTKK